MAKRLSKALRGKRRWIGLIVSAEIKSKQDALKSLEMLFTDRELGGIPRLTEYNQNQLSGGQSVAIIQVKLPDYHKVRNILDTKQEEHGKIFTKDSLLFVLCQEHTHQQYDNYFYLSLQIL